MKYIDKMPQEQFYIKLNEKIKGGNYSKEVLSDVESFMNKYKNPQSIIEMISKFIVYSANDIDDLYKTLTDDEYMEFVDYPNDIRKIQKDFADMGFILSPLEADAVWISRSDNWSAQWLDMRDTNTFVECILFCIIQPY